MAMNGATPSELLRVDSLRKHFRVSKPHGLGSSTLRAVDGVSFALGKGETLGLVGESGCGKSTLGRTIVGLHEASGGHVFLNGRDISGTSRRARSFERREMQIVFQDPYASLDPRMSVHEIIAEPLRINGMYSRERVTKMLTAVGLQEGAATRKPAEFSGGQRQRIAIARALALDPELVILDEAVSALDVSIQAQIINLLKALQRASGVAYLFIAHDLSVVRYISDRVAVMYLGRIVESGTRDEVFGSPQHPYTQALLSAVPRPDPARRRASTRIVLKGELPDPLAPPSGCGFRTRCPKAQAICASVTPVGASDPRAHAVACHFPGPLESSSSSSANVPQ